MIQIWTADEEAERLGERFRALKENTGMGQAKFARQYDVPGGASIVNQHIKGHRPISQKAAIAYAKGFGCPLVEISPRIALEVESAADVNAGSSPEAEQPSALAVIAPMPLRQTLERLAYFIGESPPDKREIIGSMLDRLAKHPHDKATIDLMLPWMAQKAD
jgi:hypothetical protein